ncbi:hypothetical protein [Paenibacillus polymyxa]|uniref:hypothetical protein n=1 Tax=Paenibacillus polymyxa TaxID=1406 RepID=UPI002AB36763|nr:hypothetical protein [Paenibacillus polymyxa]MDY8023359.1 hypothetical protein [Paenibacillus polymyxa]
MNELDFKKLSDKVIDKINEQIEGDINPLLDTATILYTRRMLLAYHQELINKGLLNHRQSDEG